MAASDRIELVDNTLREGEQTPGVAFGVDEKLDLLSRLYQAGIRRFDAAFAESDALEAEFLSRARAGFPGAVVGASCRLLKSSLRDVRDAGAHEAFVVAPVSDLHLATRLRITRQDLLDRLAAELPFPGGLRINVVLEDAFRADPEFLETAALHAAALGADKVFLADTVGGMLPWQVAPVVRHLRSVLPASVGLGTHCHNDLGLALANTLAALDAGATFATAAMNGLGERAGNTDLLQLAVAAELLLGRPCGADLPGLADVSRHLARLTGILPPANAPLVGHNAFRHTSGIHVHGMLADQRTYEVVPPSLLGRTSELALGRHTGRNHIRHLLALRGVADPAEAQVQRIVARVKESSLDTSRRQRARALADAVEAFEHETLGVDPGGLLDP